MDTVKWYPPHERYLNRHKNQYNSLWINGNPIGVTGYRNGCRCVDCTDANRVRQAEYRKTHPRSKRNA